MTSLLKHDVTYGTASDMTLSRSVPVAGKTGTSNANTDRWFIGYTPDLLCGVWYGHKDARDIGTHKINPAVTIFDGLMSRLYAKNAAETITLNKKNKFPTSENVISALYCKDSGKAPAYACSHDLRGHRVVLGYFKKGTEPRSACDEHILLDYDKEAKTLACEKCPEENRIRVAFVKGYARSFPCQIHVLDAEFMYRHLPFGASPTLDPTKAFFQNYYEKNGNYIGVSGAEKAHNRYCTEYETTAEETTTADILTETTETHIENPAENMTSPEKNDTSAPPETTEIFTETEETTTQKLLVPWW